MAERASELCDECNRRAEINPLARVRLQKPRLRRRHGGRAEITDHLCDECCEHYGAVKGYLDGAGVSNVEDPTLVRGLDYYTRTVFEGAGDRGQWAARTPSAAADATTS